ncbi:acyltransferase [Marinicella pacifica]|uniref:Acyltransferase n=1 Tax=Marinicella pacifica TaxID=1171543 RepID=A0A917CFB2_9GAMM|nr:acyltransferase [Marinicella pacifica]GGF85737.1 acyltransferase [Marinicella pacifica]
MKFIKGVLSALILLINTLVMVTILMLVALLKLLIPIRVLRVLFSKILVLIAETWVAINSLSFRCIHGSKIETAALPELSRDDWYLVVANHQSVTDIPVLQAVFNRRIPFLKFFLKQELIWVPFLGLAWWALDFPFMKRYSRETLAKKPHLKGKDMEATRKSCEQFRHFPTSVINFVEGTRFTPTKHDKQNSPYRYLLKPKAGGVGFVLGALGEKMQTLLLVTLAYKPKPPTMWQYLSGDFEKVRIKVEKIAIPASLLQKNYMTDAKFKQELFNWLEQMWYKQDSNLGDFYGQSDI